jgi:hypothetical protein
MAQKPHEIAVEHRECFASVGSDGGDNLVEMSLFDATAVTPPRPCSRCGTMVAVTSLFCPDCGQSMVRPREVPEVAVEPDIALGDHEAESTETSEPDTLQRATGWIRRSLNLGKKPLLPDPNESSVDSVLDPEASSAEQTQAMSLFDITQAEEVAVGKSRRTEPALRFLLSFDNGVSVTVGALPGFIGTRDDDSDEHRQRICLEDTTGSVAAEHLEFGQQDGVFWVKDLDTDAGTTVEEPGSPALQCIPFDTYSVVRGSTVTLGAVSFTLH